MDTGLCSLVRGTVVGVDTLCLLGLGPVLALFDLTCALSECFWANPEVFLLVCGVVNDPFTELQRNKQVAIKYNPETSTTGH